MTSDSTTATMTTTTTAPAAAALLSTLPNDKVKFLCSHGGKILPRPTDGHLKYVGGETRVISVSRDITFSELMVKLAGQFDTEMVLKYQLMPEDLDALVSVRSYEDLRHMLDENDRHERMSSGGNPKLRTFLFPAKPTVIENRAHSPEPQALEQRYIDAINGIVRGPPSIAKILPLKVNRGTFSISSACTSPTTTPSPEGPRADHLPQEAFHRMPMHKVHSSPSLCGLNNGTSNNGLSGHSNHLIHQQCRQNGQYPISRQYNHNHGLHSLRPLQHPNRGPSSTEVGSNQMGTMVSSYYYPPTGYYRQSGGGCGAFGNYDDCTIHVSRGLEKADSLPASPPSPYWERPYYRGWPPH